MQLSAICALIVLVYIQNYMIDFVRNVGFTNLVYDADNVSYCLTENMTSYFDFESFFELTCFFCGSSDLVD